VAQGGNQSGTGSEPIDWVARAADAAIRHAQENGGASGQHRVITCASGASPSGPIHLGNLREFLTPHLVAEEIRRRGLAVRHLHSWDDFDRFRKVPAGVDPSWAEHIGRPLSAVPDPWLCHESWAEHFKAPLRAALDELGVEVQEVSQSERYRAGAYTEQVLRAVRDRDVVEEVLARYRTKKAEPVAGSEQEAAALEESIADEDERTAAAGRFARFPYKPYCRDCARDTVEVAAYDDTTTDLDYTCSSCAFSTTINLATQHEGKLVWKVDWPMRWYVEGVDFESGGLDHSAPSSSYTVGKELVSRVFGFRAPSYVGYAFVGFAGMQKMSSSSGGVPTAADALRVMEAPILRWLYARRLPKQSFTIDFGPEVVRLYDEWDSLARRADDLAKRDAGVLAYERACATTTAGLLPRPKVVVPFRLLSSIADVTAGSADMISETVTKAGYAHERLGDLQPRLGRAMAYTAEFVPAADRTVVRGEPDVERLSRLTPVEAGWLAELRHRLPDEFELGPMTSLLYGVPKLAHGLDIDDARTEQVKLDQKDFFRLLYHLLVGAERGPRLPTLFLALGAEWVRALLSPLQP